MHNVLIVDDDLPVRMDLRSLLDWKKYGLELVDDAANGMEALERVNQYQPQIMILDLGMPVMNGLEVIRKLKEKKYTGKIIVLSCHDDFNSVSEALKMGAADYILKYLLKPESLSASINKALDLLKMENSERVERARIEFLSGMSLSVLRSNLIKDLVTGNMKDKDQISKSIRQLEIDISLNKFVLGLMEVDDLYLLKEKYPKAELMRLFKSAGDVLEATIKGSKCISGNTGEGEYCILIDFENTHSFMHVNSKTYELCERILANMKSYLNFQVSIGLSRICEDPCAVDECYTQARLTLDGKLYMGRNRVIHFSEVENYNRKLENFLAEYEAEISNAVFTNKSGIDPCIHRIFSSLAARNIKPEYVKVLCFELLMLSNKLAKEYVLGYEEIYGYDYIPYNLVMNMETLDDISEWFISVCYRINQVFTERIKKLSTEEIRTEIRKALEYIDNNYMRDFSLQEVADFCGLSRNYFSQVFKQEMHESFIDFLTKCRIEKAKHLLKTTGLKVYEVGMACGFDNYRYFTRLFKDFTGFSPVEYKSGQPS